MFKEPIMIFKWTRYLRGAGTIVVSGSQTGLSRFSVGAPGNFCYAAIYLMLSVDVPVMHDNVKWAHQNIIEARHEMI